MIIGFEGHSYTGKTTIVNALGALEGFTPIAETDVYAGGIDHYPEFPPIDENMARKNVDFFARLEEERLQDTKGVNETILLDRTFLSVLLFQKFIRDHGDSHWRNALDYAKVEYHRRIEQDQVVLPEALCLINCASEAEFASRCAREVSVELLRTVEAYRFFCGEYNRILEPYRELGKLATISNHNGSEPEAMGYSAISQLDTSPLTYKRKKQLAHEAIERL